MWIATQEFHVPKQGSSEEEYEDACFPPDAFCGEVFEYRCAVADGATESAFSGEWANLLVDSFGNHELRLAEQQTKLQQMIGGRQLPWYLQAKAQRGAHATFAGLSLREEIDSGNEAPIGTWHAFAVGDSCMFHVRDTKLLEVGPMNRSEDFGNSPRLLSSQRTKRLMRHAPELSVMNGRWEANDVFYLATDAMAQWILSEVESGHNPWGLLEDQGPETFPIMIAILRETKRLHNDDTTLLRVEVV